MVLSNILIIIKLFEVVGIFLWVRVRVGVRVSMQNRGRTGKTAKESEGREND